jgi:hypothetical protein
MERRDPDGRTGPDRPRPESIVRVGIGAGEVQAGLDDGVAPTRRALPLGDELPVLDDGDLRPGRLVGRSLAERGLDRRPILVGGAGGGSHGLAVLGEDGGGPGVALLGGRFKRPRYGVVRSNLQAVLISRGGHRRSRDSPASPALPRDSDLLLRHALRRRGGLHRRAINLACGGGGHRRPIGVAVPSRGTTGRTDLPAAPVAGGSGQRASRNDPAERGDLETGASALRGRQTLR